MSYFEPREMHLIKKALAIAILAIDAKDGPFQSASDMQDMKGLLDKIILNDAELAHYTRSARIAFTGKPE